MFNRHRVRSGTFQQREERDRMSIRANRELDWQSFGFSWLLADGEQFTRLAFESKCRGSFRIHEIRVQEVGIEFTEISAMKRFRVPRLLMESIDVGVASSAGRIANVSRRERAEWIRRWQGCDGSGRGRQADPDGN